MRTPWRALGLDRPLTLRLFAFWVLALLVAGVLFSALLVGVVVVAGQLRAH